LVAAATALILVLSYRPARNLMSRHQLMNFSFEPLRLVNAYGAFGGINRERYELVIEGTGDARADANTRWVEYEFKGKPGDPRRRPRQIAPYHLRLDWLMWFAAISSHYAEPWLTVLLAKLLRNERDALKLLRGNPFPSRPPRYMRVLLYRYRYSAWRELRDRGLWWRRELVGEFVRPVRLREADAESDAVHTPTG
jgi:hypothetical protein